MSVLAKNRNKNNSEQNKSNSLLTDRLSTTSTQEVPEYQDKTSSHEATSKVPSQSSNGHLIERFQNAAKLKKEKRKNELQILRSLTEELRQCLNNKTKNEIEAAIRIQLEILKELLYENY